MLRREAGPPTRIEGLQRRVRRLAPEPVRRADLVLFRRVAATRLPVVGWVLPVLSRWANHSRLWIGIAAALATLGGRKGRRAALRGLLSVATTSTLTNLPAKLLTGRERPDLSTVPEVRHLARIPTSTSFPSGHSASAFAFATGAAMELPKARVPLYGLAGAVAASRVYTGVHYPGDVVAGAAIGVAVARATTRTWPLADPRPSTAAVATDAEPLAEPDGSGIVLVANAGSGTALGERPEQQLREALPGMRTIEAHSGEQLPELLARAAGDARVLGIAGGDGSAGAAAAAAHEAGIPLLIVAAGTLNHLATDLGVDEVEASIRAIKERRAIAMDLGDIDGRPFVNAASVGLYPHLVADREKLEGRIGKWPAALWCLLRLLITGRPTEVEVDGRLRRVWLLFFGNGIYRNEGLAPHRRTGLDNGKLDVRLVDAEVAWARTRLVASVLSGRLGQCRAYERWTAEQVEIRSLEGPLRIAQDGETWTGPEEFAVRTRPRALVVMQPDPAASATD